MYFDNSDLLNDISNYRAKINDLDIDAKTKNIKNCQLFGSPTSSNCEETTN